MAFLRSVVNTTAISSSAFPAAFSLSSLSLFPSSSSSSSSPISKALNSSFLRAERLGPIRREFARPPFALHMDATSTDHKLPSQIDEVLPELLTEYMVDMKCEGCVNAVKNELQTVDGVKNVEVDLSNQVVRVLGSSPVKTLTEALEQTGRKARIIGQGVPEDFLVSAAVAEFKGPDIYGVVRLAQVSIELATIEASFSGLSPGKHGWSINEFGDITKGAASTGKVFNPMDQTTVRQPLGDLGTLDVNEKGEAFFSGIKKNLRVSDLIGRSIVVYETKDRSDQGLVAAVIARSAGVGDNYKKLCTCDGTTIWEATNSDFITSKV